MELGRKLEKALLAGDILRSGGKYVVGLSGGADSLALTEALRLLAGKIPFSLVAVHVQHHLRGEEAERDAALVAEYCAARGLPLVRVDVDVQGYAGENKLSLETAAREKRYEALEKARQEYGADYILLAHHLDDQAETVLLHLLRGSGTGGLRGMLPVRGRIFRPFLGLRRKELEEYCREHGLSYCLDSSNEDIAFRRNWLRHVLLPQLREINPEISEALARTAALSADDEECLNDLALQYLRAGSKEDADGLRLDVRKMPHKAIATRALRLCLEKVGGGEYGFAHVEDVLALVAVGTSGKRLELPGVDVLYEYGSLLFRKNRSCAYVRTCIPLVSGKPVKLPDGRELLSEVIERRQEALPDGICFPLELIKGELQVRNRLQGDLFRPRGSGSKKLKEYLIDTRIPQRERDGLLLVADEEKVIWVIGIKPAGWRDGVEYNKWLRLWLEED